MIRKSRLIRLTQDLLRINSENPPGNELACARRIERDLRSLGAAVRTYSFVKNRPNVVATLKGSWPRQKAAAEAILITPHFDTVPLGKGWKFKPLGGEVVGGRIYGRGASDDKGNAAVCMEVMASLAQDGVRLKRDLVLAATVDEETGSHQGIVPLLEKKILKPAAAVILDSDEFDTIIAQKGLLHTRIQIFGRKAHGAYNWRGVNAIEIAARVIDRLKKLEFAFNPHPLLHGPTMNIGVIKGGDKVNMVADFCEFAIDTRFAIGMDPRKILATHRAVLRRECKRFKIIVDDLQQPYEIDREHPLVKTYLATARRLGMKAALRGSEGATVITFFKKRGIPAFATGYGSRGTAHTNDEYAEVQKLYQGARLLEQYLKDFDAVATGNKR